MDLHRRGEGGEGDTIWICTGEEEKEERLDGEKKNSVGKRTSIARVTFCSFFSMQIMNFFNQWCLKERAYEKRLLKFDFLLPLGKMKAVLSFTSVSYERNAQQTGSELELYDGSSLDTEAANPKPARSIADNRKDVA
ncbi:hypothetical protein RRG08_011799 [Elysia crispata]|uniref:Uncharacterized protein n=1 Tax=Elysia crispata TaxID=231223 RepID=A0AAE1AIU1_9GAST|nr:hypothetical protein RRG08_011799 [Elysia crispata]